MKGILVSVVPEMIVGQGIENNKIFKDYQFLDERQKQAVDKFIEKVSNGEELEGKNKPSWKNDDNGDICGSFIFEQHKCWHYHSGPNYKKGYTNPKTINLEFNPCGRTSPEIIHYRKIGGDHILITAFSPQHIPFPAAIMNSSIMRKSKEERLKEFIELMSLE